MRRRRALLLVTVTALLVLLLATGFALLQEGVIPGCSTAARRAAFLIARQP